MTSSIGFLLAMALLLASWLGAWRTRKTPSSAAFKSWYLLACLSPAVLVTLVWGTSVTRFGDLRIAVEGLRLHMDRLDEETITVGGSRSDDYLYVSGLPEGMIAFTRKGDGSVEIRQRASSPREGGGLSFGAVRVNENKTFHNTVEIDAPVTFVLADGRRLIFDRSRLAVQSPSSAGSFEPLPPRINDVLGFEFEIKRQLPPQQVIYPLRFYGVEKGHDDQELLSSQGEALGTFLFREASEDEGLYRAYLRNGIFAALLDPEVRIETAPGTVQELDPVVATLAEGESLHLALFRIDYHDPRTQSRRSRAQERRSFEVRFHDDILDVIFDTPGYVRLRRPDLDEMREKREAAGLADEVILALVGPDMEQLIGETQMALRYRFLGDVLGPELFSRIEAPKWGSYFKVTTHQGTRRYRYGEACEIGDVAAVIVRLTRLDLPWGVLAVVWILTLSSLLTSFEVRRFFLRFVLLSGTEMLLALRILIAYQAANLDTSQVEAAWQSVGALAWIPFALQTTVVLYERRKWLPQIAQGIVALGALAVVEWKIGDDLGTAALLLVIAAVAPLLLRGAYWLLDWLPLGVAAIRRLTATRWWIWLGSGVVLLAVFRVLTLLILGWKERIVVPGMPIMAVSIYYTPAVLLIFGLIWGALVRSSRLAALLVYLPTVAVLLVALPALANDFGFVLIFPLPVLVLFCLPLPSTRKQTALRNAMLALPLAAVFVLHLSVAFLLPLLPGLGPAWAEDSYDRAIAEPAEAEILLGQRLDADRNLMRLWNIAFPQRLREIGTTDSEGLLVVMANLRDYASRGPLGEGYLGVPLSVALRATHVDDNVSAVHVLAAFGWLGGLAVLLLFALWGLAPLGVLQAKVLPADLWPRHAFGLMVLWTFFAAGMYMFSANTELLFFTGKNVYFLAAASRSDALEAALLVALALWAFHPTPPARAK